MKERVFNRDIVLILVASFFYMCNPQMILPLITGFTGSLGGSAALMGLVGGLMTACSMCCRPVAGNLSDRVSKARLSSLGCILLAVASLGYTLAKSPLLVIIARIINGVGYACCSVCMSTWVSNLLPPEKIGSGMGIYGVVIALGNAVAPSLGIALYQHFGYRVPFFISIFSALIALLIVNLVHDKGEAQVLPKAVPGTEKPRLKLIDKQAVPVALIVMLFGIPYFVTQSFLVNYVSTRGIDISVSLFFPIYAAVLLTLRLLFKNLFDKLPFAVFVIAGSVNALLGMFFLTIMNSNLHLFLAAIFMAGGYGITYTVCQATVIIRADGSRRGLANSTFFLGLDIGMALGPMIGGVLYGSVKISLFYPLLMLSVPLLLLVLFVSERRRNQAAAAVK